MWLGPKRRHSCCLQEGCGHSGLKDSRVLWLGDSQYIATAGFDSVSNSSVAVLGTWSWTVFVVLFL